MNVDEQASKSRPAASSRHPQSAAATDKPDPKPSARKKFTPSKKSIAGKRSASRKPAVAARKTTKARTYAKLTDAKIKLQALAWSSDATRRMAVINGRIVREGESMDGYQINQIRQDDVVVSDGRQSWRLEFGLKQ
jgi:type II secretory pathway component PulC